MAVILARGGGLRDCSLRSLLVRFLMPSLLQRAAGQPMDLRRDCIWSLQSSYSCGNCMGECELRILLMMWVVEGLLRRLELSHQVGVCCCFVNVVMTAW